jgi:hypothetical protein
MKREEGFYWVHDSLEWIVARWEKSWKGYEEWFVPGQELTFTDEDFDQINEKRIQQ